MLRDGRGKRNAHSQDRDYCIHARLSGTISGYPSHPRRPGAYSYAKSGRGSGVADEWAYWKSSHDSPCRHTRTSVSSPVQRSIRHSSYAPCLPHHSYIKPLPRLLFGTDTFSRQVPCYSARYRHSATSTRGPRGG